MSIYNIYSPRNRYSWDFSGYLGIWPIKPLLQRSQSTR